MPLYFTLKQLQVFMACVKFKNYTKAAVFLHTTQPAISMQIKKFETQVGNKLFSISLDKSVQLTPVGQAIYKKLNKTYKNIEDFSQFIHEFKGTTEGNLSLGIPSSCAHYLLSRVKSFQANYPDVELDIQILPRKQLLKAIQTHQIDLAIMGHVSLSSLCTEFICSYNLCLVVSALHPLASKNRVAVKDLLHEIIILGEAGSEPRLYLENNIVTAKSKLFYVNSSQAVLTAVEENIGISVAGVLDGGSPGFKKIKALAIKDLPLKRDLHLVYKSLEDLSPIAKKMRTHLLL